MTHSGKWSWLKAWGMKIARHRSMKRAIVAVARRLAVIMHRVGGWHRVSLDQGRSCGHMTGSVRWWCASLAARMIARWARSPSSPRLQRAAVRLWGLTAQRDRADKSDRASMHTCTFI